MNLSDSPFGYRRTAVYGDHKGEPQYSITPLAQDDFLNPQDGDRFVLGANHERDVAELYRALQNHHQHHHKLTVYRSLKMIWGIDRLDQPAPDLVIVPNVRNPEQVRTAFDVSQEQVRPSTIIEVVSPLFREQDLVDKVRIYAQAGIDEYFAVDGTQSDAKRDASFTYQIVGYGLNDGVYQPIEPDDRGFLYSPINRFWIGPNPEGTGVVLLNENGKRIEPVDVVTEKKMAELEGDRRGREILSSLNFQ